MKRNILVFPCGSEIGLEIHGALQYSTYFHLIGANSGDDHGKFVFEDYIGGLPFIDDDRLIGELNRVVKERNIAAIYPTMDQVITKLKQHEAELGCPVVAPPVETTEICLSKARTYDVLTGVVRVPRVFASASEVERFPVFVKPDVGYGSKGTKLIHDAAELREALSERDDLLILEYLPGEEYTVDCFTSRRGELLYYGARKRNRIRTGISVNTFFCEDQAEFGAPIRAINGRIRFTGAWFAQFKRDAEGRLCLMEVASRLGGASTLSRVKDVNFPMLCLFDTFGYDVSVSCNDYSPVLDRAFANSVRINYAFDTVYVDYDDCLILDKKDVNAELVAFLLKAINRGKRIVLVSKHIGDLHGELKAFRVHDLFDEIIHISPDADKADYIKGENALFIDDSFAERRSIRSKRHIPAIGPDIIDMIIL